jgi:Tol biopolymer transport system component
LRFQPIVFSLVGFFVVTLILSGCGIGIQQTGYDREYQIVNTPVGEYRSVAWLTDNLIAFNYGAFDYGSTNVNDWEESLIAFHKVGTSGWSETRQFSKPEECQVGFVSFLSRLSNSQLGFVYFCKAGSPSGMLYSWDIESDDIRQLYDFPKPFFATSYSFNPADLEFIQTDSGGSNLSDSLYHISLTSNRQTEEILPDYQRVRDPSWSPDGNTIAFAGTETYSGGNSSDFTTWGEITGLFDYPWDIFLLDMDSGQVQRLLPGIQYLRSLKWSPQDTWLAFSGILEGKPGIWILNKNTEQLIHVWDDNELYFDWSPDGKQMVIIDQEWSLNEAEYQPIIIDVKFPPSE